MGYEGVYFSWTCFPEDIYNQRVKYSSYFSLFMNMLPFSGENNLFVIKRNSFYTLAMFSERAKVKYANKKEENEFRLVYCDYFDRAGLLLK